MIMQEGHGITVALMKQIRKQSTSLEHTTGIVVACSRILRPLYFGLW